MAIIPKVIHYCWFGGPLTPFAKRCIRTWKKVMPDYELRLWTEKDIKDIIQSVPFVSQAYDAGKWAFVADYVRLYALYTEGGIYLDSDVKVIRRFDEFLNCSFFSAHEKNGFSTETQSKLLKDGTPVDPNQIITGMGILSAIMGSVKGHPFLKDCIEYYQSWFFDIRGKGKIKTYNIVFHISRIAAQKYGYRYSDCYQILSEDMHIYPSSVFVGNMAYYKEGEAYAIHLINGSWGNKLPMKWYFRTYTPYLYDLLVTYPRRFLKTVRNMVLRRGRHNTIYAYDKNS